MKNEIVLNLIKQFKATAIIPKHDISVDNFISCLVTMLANASKNNILLVISNLNEFLEYLKTFVIDKYEFELILTFQLALDKRGFVSLEIIEKLKTFFDDTRFSMNKELTDSQFYYTSNISDFIREVVIFKNGSEVENETL